MSRNPRSDQSGDRTELPIERGFPIERVNEIAEKEGRAKQWYRPIYTMHKWWARRPGCLFRAISLYSLLDDETDELNISVYEPGENQTLGGNGLDETDLLHAVSEVDMEDPESLWEFYPKDVRVEDKKILDPFMGGGTSLVEASRFGAETVGYDLNPVAWFVTKKELEAGQTDPEKLQAAFEEVKDDVADEITQYYRTPCPNADHEHGEGHDADVMYNFWVKELDCVSCGHTVPLFKDYRVAKGRYENDDQYNVLCPDCGAVTLVDDWQDDSECTECSHEWVPKEGHVTRGGYYNCPECGQKESITDGIAEADGYDLRLYAVEYYCEECDREGLEKSAHKGYKKAEVADKQLSEEAKQEWKTRTDLHDYVPDEEIPPGHMTSERNPVFDHGYEEWIDMFSERQLLCFAKLLKSISQISDSNIRDYLLLTFTETLNYNTLMTSYNPGKNLIANIFNSNSFDPPQRPVENNVWGTEHGTGSFTSMWKMTVKGVKYASAPTERYLESGNKLETDKFAQPIGQKSEIHQGDMRKIEAKDEYDLVLTDPPYYDNIIYSEVSDYFYVWQKILLEDEYPGFDDQKTPRVDSIVTNPYLDKTAEDFQHEMGQALEIINQTLKENGTLAFTYHHSEEESWGELLESLCENEFEVTATYPINSDLNKFIGGEAISFDIVIVARPTEDRQPISWNALRRRIVRTAKETRKILEENRELKGGDIGVIEMGKCFQEYSKHHGKVRRGKDIMSAKDVVDEIYGIIQDNTRGEQAIYLDLLEEYNPGYDDLNKHLRHSDASEDQLKEMQLVEMDGGTFSLLDWRDEGRQAYVQDKVDEGDATPLDKAHFLRYRFEEGKSTSEYVGRWSDDDLSDVCEGLVTATGDETYLRMIGVDVSLDEYLDQ
ncbi:DUF1156 domain-containing protein [Halorubrum ezzemoulense]|uniref:DUF1156 domain-containing protein n=1 Tax=Halorubrum ezzemoulense TaxID=337243 RepID=UPI00232DA9CE|nr:DUF1156 domain-containing protein [Halorubrum ezzemoulense]MDB2272173.1 DUF1156 domain-containing protein [Halorubrum ezzemoulense]